MVKIEGIWFNEEKIIKMKRNHFIKETIKVHFLDIPEAEREKKLGRIYDDIKSKSVGPSNITEGL